MVEKIINYKTSDGKLYPTEAEAWEHQYALDVEKFLSMNFTPDDAATVMRFLRMVPHSLPACNNVIRFLYKRSGSNMVLGTNAPKPAPTDRTAILS